MTPFITHYDNLKVAWNSPSEVIRAAYRALSQKYHPDKYHDQGEAGRIMTLINEAYAVLSDPDRRRQHDEWIAQQEAKVREEERQAAARVRQAETIRVPFDDAARFTHYPQSFSFGVPSKPKPTGFFRTIFFTLITIAIVVGVISGLVTEEPNAPLPPPLAAVPRPLPAPPVSHVVGPELLPAPPVYNVVSPELPQAPPASLSSGEELTIAIACGNLQLSGDVSAYRSCISQQRDSATSSASLPDFSDLPSGEKLAIQMACGNHQVHGDLSAYRACILRQLRTIGR